MHGRTLCLVTIENKPHKTLKYLMATGLKPLNIFQLFQHAGLSQYIKKKETKIKIF